MPVELSNYPLEKTVSDRELEERQRSKWEELQYEPRRTTPGFEDKVRAGDEGLEKEVPDDPTEISLSSEARHLLKDIVDNPFKPLTKRYNRFSSRYKGNKAKDELLDQGVVIERQIKSRDGKRKLLQLTEKGRDHAGNSLDLDTKHEGRGGIVHRYWQHRIKEAFEEAGWHSFLEKFDADVYINMGNTELAVEVAMGDNPREIQHLSDHLEKGFTVWIAARNKEVLEGLKQRIQEKDIDTASVVFRLVRDFNKQELDPK